METNKIAEILELSQEELSISNFGYAQKLLSQSTSRSVKIDSAKMLFRGKKEKLNRILEVLK